jgi:predicted RNA-binding protein with RPS1 domain
MIRLPSDKDEAQDDKLLPSLPRLPVAVRLDRLAIDEIDVAESVLGQSFRLSAYGKATLVDARLSGEVSLTRLDAPGTARLQLDLAPAADRLFAKLDLAEPPGGVLASALGAASEPARVMLCLEGPASGAALAAEAQAGAGVGAVAVLGGVAAVALEDGIDGLVHISDFSWTKRIKDPKEIQELFKKGDEVEAVVLYIDITNERLSLGIKQLSEDPWDTIAQRHPVGTKVKGNVTAVTEFGVFVEIENGVEGLIHNSQLGLDKAQDVAQAFPVGTQVEAEVTNVDTQERRISLSSRAIKERARKDYDTQYMGDDEGARVTFGDLIREQMRGGDKE